jgi:hypothetical protein
MIRRIVPVLALLLIGNTARAADPLTCVPDSAHVVVVADNPRRLSEAIIGLAAFQHAQQLAPVRQLYDSTAARRLLQMLAFAEKELGAKWPELLDQLGGNGVALAVQFYVDPASALVVLSGKDDKQVEKAYALALRVVEEELARQGNKQAVKRETMGSVAFASIGNDIHTARIGAMILVSNKLQTLKTAATAAFADARSDRSKSPVHRARRDAAKVLPKGALAWLWVNFAAVKETKQAKDFFDATRQDFLQTFVVGSTIDCLKRSDFVAIGVYQEPTGFRLRLRIPAGRDGLWDDLVVHVPPQGTSGSLPLLEPPGTIYAQSFYLDASYMWKHRDRLITGDAKRDFEKGEKQLSKILPTPVKFGELIEMWGPHHRVIVANHDSRPYKVEPSLKLPAFGYVATARDPKFTKSVESLLNAAGVVGSLQFGMKRREHEHEGVTIVAYRFQESKPIPEDPDGLRFNFEPCFASVGDELMVASTLELGKKLVTELKKPRNGQSSTAVLRGAASASGAADVLAGLSDPLITDAVLGRGIGLAEARKEIAELVNFVKTLGTGRVELDVTDKEYRLDLVWELKKD